MLGANPPFTIMDGFFTRIWEKKGIEKVVAVNKGVFIVRFFNIEQCDAILNEGLWKNGIMLIWILLEYVNILYTLYFLSLLSVLLVSLIIANQLQCIASIYL